MKKLTKSSPSVTQGQALKAREAILSAALQAFARDGYDGASMPKIASMAEVAPALIHYYFGSKDNLWRETVDYSLGSLRKDSAAIHKATKSLAPLDRLRALLQAHTHFAANWPDHFVMIIAEARTDSDRFAWIQEHYTGILFEEVVTTLRDARSAGHIDQVNVHKIASILIGSILLYFTVQSRSIEGDALEKETEEFTDLLYRMLLKGVAVHHG